jgi:hypothetical protein
MEADQRGAAFAAISGFQRKAEASTRARASLHA